MGYNDNDAFADGWLKLEQVGADTLLKLDKDGEGDNFDTLVVTLKGFTMADFKDKNIDSANNVTSDTDLQASSALNISLETNSLDLDLSLLTESPILSFNQDASLNYEGGSNLITEESPLVFELESGFINLPSSSENAPQEIEDFVQYENFFSEALITLEEEDFLFVSMDV